MFDDFAKLPSGRRLRQQSYPLPAVVAVLHQENGLAGSRYLLIKREKEPYVGKWALVGGHWEFGETLSMAITREVKEETGLQITFNGLRGLAAIRIAPASVDSPGAHYLLFVCDVSIAKGTAITQSEGEIAWFDLEEITQLQQSSQIISNDYVMLAEAARQIKRSYYIELDVADNQVLRQADLTGSWQQIPPLHHSTTVAAGGIVYASFSDKKYILLVCREDDLWVLPKGHQEPNESVEQAALREIYEESNISPSDLMVEGLIGTYIDATYADETKFVCMFKFKYIAESMPRLITDAKHKATLWWPVSDPLPSFRYKEQLTLVEDFIQTLQ